MQDFFASYHSFIYFHSVLLLALWAVLSYRADDRLTATATAQRSQAIGVLLLACALALFVGLRTAAPQFGDTGNYMREYQQMARIVRTEVDSDWLFYRVMSGMAKAGWSVSWFFLLVAAVYFLCTAKFCRDVFGRDAMIAFTVVLASFEFYSFSINGIRNGVAIALMLPAIYYAGRRTWLAVGFALMAYHCHSSVALTIGALVLASLFPRPKIYFAGWLVCLVASVVAGAFFENLFLAGGLIDSGHEMEYYLNENSDMSLFSRTGYRWDFLLYGVIPIVWGTYFIIMRGYRDKLYLRLVSIYLINNAFWLLVNQNWLSNRIAYLSWCLSPFLLVYPVLKMSHLPQRRLWLAAAVFGTFGFSYLMWWIK